jgi:hypothetical protein
VVRLGLRVRRPNDVPIPGMWSAQPTVMVVGTTHPVGGTLHGITFDQPLRSGVPVRLGLDDLPPVLRELLEDAGVMSGLVIPLSAPG